MSLVAIGVCRRTFGTDGALKIESLSGEYSHFLSIVHVFLKKGSESWKYEVDYWQIGKFQSLVKFKKIDTPESAKRLTGWKIWVPVQFSCPLEAGEWYVSDIRGTKVYVDEQQVGIVSDIIDTGGVQYLEMKGLDHQNFLIPINDNFLSDFSPEKIVLKHSWILL